MLDQTNDATLQEAKQVWEKWFSAARSGARNELPDALADTLMEQVAVHACTHCGELIPAGEPRRRSPNDGWLHLACEGTFIAAQLGFAIGDVVDSDLKSKHLAFTSKRIRGFDMLKGHVWVQLEGETAAVDLKDIVQAKHDAARRIDSLLAEVTQIVPPDPADKMRKVDLAVLGFTPEQISNMTPGEAWTHLPPPTTLVPDRHVIGQFLYEKFPPLACNPYPDSWIEIAVAHPERGNKVASARTFSPFDMKPAIDYAVKMNTDGWNVYYGAALRQQAKDKDGNVIPLTNGRAKDCHVATGFDAWSDFDRKGDAERIDRVLKEKGWAPYMVVWTGSTPCKRGQVYLRLDEAPTPDDLETVNKKLVELFSDGDEQVDNVSAPAHVMRLPGTINYPTPEKRARGYVVEMTTLDLNLNAPSYTVEQITGVAASEGTVTRARSRRERRAHIDMDAGNDEPQTVERAINYLVHGAPMAIQGKGGDNTTWWVAAKVKDIGLTKEGCLKVMWENWNSTKAKPPWTLPGLAQKVLNAYKYGQNEVGCDDPLVIFKDYIEWVKGAGHDLVTGEAIVSTNDKADDKAAALAIARADFGITDDKPKDEPPTAAPPGLLFDPWAQFVVPAFPHDVLPSVVQDFAGAQAEVVGVDEASMAMCAVTALSGALSHELRLKMMRHGNWYVSPRLWTVLYGDPSTKKTPAINAATQPLEDYQAKTQMAYQQALRTYEDFKDSSEEEMRKPCPPVRYVVWNTTPEKLAEMLARGDRGLLIKSDELAGWIGAMEKYGGKGSKSADRGFWLKAYDGGSYGDDRITRGEIFVKNLSISHIGGIQPDRLAEIQGLTSDGLLQRFVPVVMGPATLPIDRPCDVSGYNELVRALVRAQPVELALTGEALEAMADLRKHIYELTMHAGGLAKGFVGFLGKLDGMAGSLALILHMAEHPPVGLLDITALTTRAAPRPIGLATVERVDRLVREFILPHAMEFYRSADSGGDRLKRLASWILTNNKNRIIASDITRNVAECRGLSMFELNQRMSPLVAVGWVIPEHNNLGPMNWSWQVNQAVGAQFKERARSETAAKARLAALMNSPRKQT